jgi:G3E family GTPase
MPKRGRSPSEDAHAVASKQTAPQRIILCGLYDEGKTAVAKCLLKELRSATVIACDLKTGRRAVPKKSGEFEVRVYTETPQLQTQGLLNVVLLSHVLAQPSRVAAAMASGNSAARLLTVLDARSFLDEWESPEELPVALREAAKLDARAHMRDKKKAGEVLAECVESADVIALSHADAADADELEMLEAMLRELNPSAAIVRRAGDGEGGGKILKHVRASPECAAPNGRSGCWQAVLAARKQETGEEGGVEDEDQEGEAEEDTASACACDAGDEHDEGDENDEGELEVEEANEDWVVPVMSRFAFLARRPFHPARLHKLLKRGQLDGVIRSTGIIWVATHPEDRILWNQVGGAAPVTHVHAHVHVTCMCMCMWCPNVPLTLPPLLPGHCCAPFPHFPSRVCTGGQLSGSATRRAMAPRNGAARDRVARRRSEMGALRRARGPAR